MKYEIISKDKRKTVETDQYHGIHFDEKIRVKWILDIADKEAKITISVEKFTEIEINDHGFIWIR